MIRSALRSLHLHALHQHAKGDYYVSPHCASQLRFPPSARYVEWKGRCFRCCRMGHSASRCKNPKRCGKCWGHGHIGSFCKIGIQSNSNIDTSTKPESKRVETRFEELFQGNLPLIDLPEDRPQKIVCFIERDEQYYKEMGKLDNAVVMCNPSLEVDLSIEQVAEYAASSGLVKASDISVGVMTKSRYVIMLPICIDPAKLIRGIPSRVWEEGFSFSLWCPLDDAKVVVPNYKIMLDLVGIPLDLYREQNVIRATSAIGTYLGTVDQVMEGDVACWTVVVATSSLSLIPRQVAYRIGGFEKLVDVIPKACVKGDVYKPDELPQPKEKFLPPMARPSSANSSSSMAGSPRGNVDDHFIGSRKVMEELCQGIDFLSLPAGVVERFYPLNLDRSEVLMVAAVMRCTQTQLPISYLGMPLTIRKPCKKDFIPLLEKIESRIEGWTGKFLSKGGRVQLINSVLSSVPIYLMTCFELPKWVVRRIESLCRNFLWGKSHSQKRGLPLISWEVVCLPKCYGGLGVANLEFRNKSLLLRWWWKATSIEGGLWYTVIQLLRKNKPSQQFPKIWLVEGSFFWNQLIKLYSLFQWLTTWNIGNGEKISYWYDVWGEVPLRRMKDRLPKPIRQHISLKEAILTRERLQTRHINCEDHCVMCDMDTLETSHHLFFQCVNAREIWACVGDVMQEGASVQATWEASMVRYGSKQGNQRQIWIVLFMAVLWSIWRQRNEVIFRGTKLPVRLVANRAKEEAQLWLRFCKRGK